MALFYKQKAYQSNKTTTLKTKSSVRPGLLRLGAMLSVPCLRLIIYVLLARAVGVQAFGLLLLLQWIAASLLPLVGIGIDPASRKRIVRIQEATHIHTMASIFSMLWRQQCRRICYFLFLYTLLAYVLSWASAGVLSLPLLFCAGLAVIPLFINSIVGIALQSQGRHTPLALLSILNALLICIGVLLAIRLPVSGWLRMGLFLLIPGFVHTVTLTLALLALFQTLPLRRALPVGPLLTERLRDATRISPLTFLFDICLWRELPLLLFLLIPLHHVISLATLSCYAFSILFATRLIEIIPTFFVTGMLPTLSVLFKKILARPFSLGRYDAFVQTTCYLSLFATLLCTLFTLFCPQLVLFGLGTSYLPMVKIVRILLIAVACSSIATISLTQLEHHAQMKPEEYQFQQQSVRIMTLCSLRICKEHVYRAGVIVMYIMVMLLCIMLWGIVGAACASMMVRVGVALYSVLRCHALLRPKL